VQASYYWSSTTFAYNTDLVWKVHLYSGYVDGPYESYYPVYVWPVRAGQTDNWVISGAIMHRGVWLAECYSGMPQ